MTDIPLGVPLPPEPADDAEAAATGAEAGRREGAAGAWPRRLVLDTSIFTNPDVRGAFGPSPTAALAGFLDLARRLAGLVELYMPPSVYAELSNFLDPAAVPPDIELWIRRKPPSKLELTVPAFLLYELIEDVRRRVDKGLRVAEDHARDVAAVPEEGRIASLRRKYREALREGIIDSTEDVELILLAKELGALVVSADRGVIAFTEKLGLPWLDPQNLHGLLTKLAAGAATGAAPPRSP